MTESDSIKIKLTKEELSNIIKYFERDRQYINKESGHDEDADMYLELLKSFKQQILNNQEIAERLRDHKQYHQLCKSKFSSEPARVKYHHAMYEELKEIERE